MAIGKTSGFSPVPLSGGLNTSYPHTNLEPNESPDMMNMQVDFDGSLVKRKGVTTLATAANTPFTYSLSYTPILVPIKTPFGKNLMVVRNNNNLVVYAENSSTGYWTVAKTFSNVFRESDLGIDSEIAWNYTVINEGFTTKIVFTHPDFVPLQMTFYCGREMAATYTATTVVVSSLPVFMDSAYIKFDDMFAFFNTNTVGVPTNYVDGITPPSWGSGTWTFASTDGGNRTARFDYVICCLQWWAEALYLRGEQIMNTVAQSVSSRDIPVPPVLTNDIDRVINTSERFPYHVYTSAAFDTRLGYTTPPTLSTQWSHSSGEYVASGAATLPSSAYWITIGANVTTARTLMISRGYKLPFYGDQGADAYMSSPFIGTLVVRDINGSDWSRQAILPPSEGGVGAGTVNGYFLRNGSGYGVSTSTASGTRIPYITFDATQTSSGGQGAVRLDTGYIVMDGLSKTHYDNERLGQVTNYTSLVGDNSGYNIPQYWSDLKYPTYMSRGFPVFGISDYCNYATGSFPAVTAYCQSRLVIAGMKNDPLRVVFSNVQDAHGVPGIYCNNFQTSLETEYDEDSAFDIALSSRGDDRITALLEFNDKLFVWTKYRTFMIYSDTGVLNFATAKYSIIAERGCANGRSVALMDNTPAFISNDGVYAIVPNDKSSAYGAEQISTKIRKTFVQSSSLLGQYGWLLYDGARKELYVGLLEDSGFIAFGAGTTSKAPLLFVYKPQFNSWSQYSIDGYSFPAYSGCIIHESAGLPRVFLSMKCNALSIEQHRLCEANNNYYVDLLDVDTWVSGTKIADFGTHKLTWYYNGATDYLWANYPNSSPCFARAIPYRGYLDIAVYWETGVATNAYNQLVENVQFIKTQHGIRLLEAHPTGGNVRVLAFLQLRGKTETRLDFKFPGVVVQDGIVRLPFEMSVGGFAGDQYGFTFNLSFTPTSSPLYMGTIYPTWVTTPAITGETLTTKNIKHYVAYYDNRIAPINSKVRISTNVGLMYDDTYDGFLSEELYGYMYDELLAGLWYTTDMYNQQQYKSYSRVLFPVIGSYQLMNVIHFTYSPGTFKLVGYEVEYVKTKREGYSATEGQTLR